MKMQYTEEQIIRANQTDLVSFLNAQGEQLMKSGKEYRWKKHDSVTVSGNRWYRHSQGKGGYPVDFVMEFYNATFPEAVKMLTGEEGEGRNSACPAPSPDFRLPEKEDPAGWHADRQHRRRLGGSAIQGLRRRHRQGYARATQTLKQNA